MMTRLVFAVLNIITSLVIGYSLEKTLEMNHKERALAVAIAFIALTLLDIFERLNQIRDRIEDGKI